MPDEPVQRWLIAARDPAVVGELEAIYHLIADQVALHRPVCVSSGRCCKFREYGHRLYTTGLEAAYLVARLPADAALTPAAVDAAVQRGDCPFLVGTSCGVHEIKPSGCRIFFCDESAGNWQHPLTERVMGMVRGLHERHGVPYRYAEWRSLLALFAGG
jgi:Fe-S-cluster containining protein